MSKLKNQRDRIRKRHRRVRVKVHGTADRTRLCVYRSLNNIYAQIVDDNLGFTLVAASSLDPEIRDKKDANKKDVAAIVGQLIAKRAQEKGINKVVFDRGGYIYHGRVKFLADGARSSGLKF